MKINRDYFEHTMDRYSTVRSGIDACLPGVIDSDGILQFYIDQLEAHERMVRDYVRQQYTEVE